MLGHVAGELLGVELARGDHEVVDRLVGLDPEHDRGVPELQVEVDEERPLALVLGEGGGEVRGQDGLARSALRREHGDDAPAPGRSGGGAPAGPARLANGEDHVLGHLRKGQDVGDVGLECLLEKLRRGVGSHDDDRRPGVLPDRCQLVERQARAARGVEDNLEVTSCEGRGRLGHAVVGAHELDLPVLLERVTEAVEAVAGAGEEDPHLLARGYGRFDGHSVLLPGTRVAICLALRPSVRIVPTVSTLSGLSAASSAGRSWSVQYGPSGRVTKLSF